MHKYNRKSNDDWKTESDNRARKFGSHPEARRFNLRLLRGLEEARRSRLGAEDYILRRNP